MTNLQIIAGALELNQIKEEVDTYAGWKRRGYQVKRGEHALFQTKIWKPVKDKNDKAEDDEQVTFLEDGKKLILVRASFFGRSQVDKAQIERAGA